MDPIQTIRKALKKENLEFLSLARMRPITPTAMKKMKDMQDQIQSYGVSGIFT